MVFADFELIIFAVNQRELIARLQSLPSSVNFLFEKVSLNLLEIAEMIKMVKPNASLGKNALSWLRKRIESLASMAFL